MMPLEPPSEVGLLKLIWHPDDVIGDQVKPTAFTSRDLSGKHDDHVSVDREDLASRAVMEATAERQAAKADGVNFHRELALVSKLPCGEVRAVTFEEKLVLNVEPRILPDNEAHCGIINVSGVCSRSFLNEVRGKLALLATPACAFDEVYGSIGTGSRD